MRELQEANAAKSVLVDRRSGAPESTATA